MLSLIHEAFQCATKAHGGIESVSCRMACCQFIMLVCVCVCTHVCDHMHAHVCTGTCANSMHKVS